MKTILAFLILMQSHLILASEANYTGEKTNIVTQNTSRYIKAIISQKSIQNVLKTVELLKQQTETVYRHKKAKVTKKQSI